ncbi:MAG TPA: winged helix-turn-helix domain-containing protein [Candidatus Binatia bacterium]|nr:winged helix-turn-helix domain-containing protein [Candidatus Binatia bacterium]
MEEKIVLDRESFKALAADTRVKILKLLHKRRHMQAEIAAELGLAIPSVKEHLDALAKAGLVERKDDGHKWKYYELTKKGKAVLDPEQKRIWIVLSLFILSVAGGLAAWGRTLLAPFYNPQATMMAKSAAPEAASLAMDATTAQVAHPFPWTLVIYGAWLALLLLVLVYSLVQRRKYLGESLTKSQSINK